MDDQNHVPQTTPHNASLGLEAAGLVPEITSWVLRISQPLWLHNLKHQGRCNDHGQLTLHILQSC
jgi:hypothetical protein